ncbi:MAG: single-stranded-DNA-specific exonuclease RecJ [Gemmatimonadota bacterium]
MSSQAASAARFGTAARRWEARHADAPAGEAAALHTALHLDLPICQLLCTRGLSTPAAAAAFLRPSLEHLHDPYALAGMDAAVARVARAVQDGETIFVHGDYDVDGICSVALLTRVLRALGGTVHPFVPHRLHDGYDLSEAGVHAAAAAGAGLIITADCGIVAGEAVHAAAAAGMDVVITDHHAPGAELPAAAAVLNPNRGDCSYPFKGLAGAGVAYKLCQALVAVLGGHEDALRWNLDLVALATIADLAPLTGENRVLAYFGLRVLRESRNTGLGALLDSAGMDRSVPLSAGSVSHGLGPRLNAAGRMGAAERGVRLLLTEDAVEAGALASEIEEENRARQRVDRDTLTEALEGLERTFDPARDYGVVLAAEGWHPGVIGIVASRVVERIHRPTVLLSIDRESGQARGSGRSIPAFDLLAGIRACAPLLTRFGGHHQAAGLEVPAERIGQLRAAFNDAARAALMPEDLVARVPVDGELPLSQASAAFLAVLQHLGPFGLGNPTPVFVARAVRVEGYPKVVGDGHVRLRLEQDGNRLEAIGFRMAARLEEVDVSRGPIDVAYQLQENHWRGTVRLQAKLVDFRAAR